MNSGGIGQRNVKVIVDLVLFFYGWVVGLGRVGNGCFISYFDIFCLMTGVKEISYIRPMFFMKKQNIEKKKNILKIYSVSKWNYLLNTNQKIFNHFCEILKIS